MQCDACHTLKFGVSINVSKYKISKYKITAGEPNLIETMKYNFLTLLCCIHSRSDEIKLRISRIEMVGSYKMEQSI